MTSAINSAILRLPRRAESTDPQSLIQTFVDVGPVFEILNGPDHQILYGRRGTGKTHVLNYLANAKSQNEDAVVVIDLRNIGSNAGLYADATVPLAERATRLLVDTLLSIHSSLVEFFIERAEELDLSRSGPALDRLADAVTEIKVTGEVEKTDIESDRHGSQGQSNLHVNVSSNPALGANADMGEHYESSASQKIRRSGHEHLYVNFGTTSAAFRGILSCMGGKSLWVLLDEWSSVPMELQPYLADLIRRSLFPIRGVTVKIGSIEHRSAFIIWRKTSGYIGIEAGADASADVNLDDFMVFDNNAEKAQAFFRELIAQHVKASARDTAFEADVPKDSNRIIQSAFTEKRAVEEFVRSCEGVPRDAINIISLAAQRAIDDPISVHHIRVAANNWYQRDKEKAVTADPEAERLLRWIVDQVIGERKARAFLLRSDANSDIIDSLYDSRVLHILKKGISSHDEPGVRYDVYKIDFGCYVNLLGRSNAPVGLLPADDEQSGYIEVPPDDYRSIRRAILNLEDFRAESEI